MDIILWASCFTWQHLYVLHVGVYTCAFMHHIPVLLRAERGAATAIAVDLLHSGADIIVAHMQHVEAVRRLRGHQGWAVQQGQTAFCQSRLETSEPCGHFKYTSYHVWRKNMWSYKRNVTNRNISTDIFNL